MTTIFTKVVPLGDEPGETAESPKEEPLVETVRRQADYLRGKTDAYYELLELLEDANRPPDPPSED